MAQPATKVAAAAFLGVGLVVLAATAPAAAASGPGRDFGNHVRECHEHFSGEMNPGVHHRGFAGWDPAHDC